MVRQLALIAGLCLLGCDSNDPNCTKTEADAGCVLRSVRDGGDETNANCLIDTPCVNDTQCVSTPGASCNTRTSECQIVKCGGERAACSIDGHCKTGHRCDNGACKFDPTPRCYSKSDGVCLEGSTSDNWMEDCMEGGGEIVSSCPSGRYGICRYKDEDGKEIAIWVYSNSAASTIRMNCGFLNDGEYTPGSS